MKRLVSICFILFFILFGVFGCGSGGDSSSPASEANVTPDDNGSPDGTEDNDPVDDENDTSIPGDDNDETLEFCSVFWFLSVCKPNYDPAGPIPEEKHQSANTDWTEMIVDETVVVELMEINSPASRENGEPPQECDYINFLRFKLSDEFRNYNDAQDADAILFMIPGILEGANGFEYIARQLVYMAREYYGLEFEIWAMDRRNNCLEDTYITDLIEDKLEAGTITSQEAVKLATEYLYEGKDVNGRTFNDWLKSSDVPFLSEFGIQMDTEDMFKIIQTMLPDPQVRKEKLFIGGHALGGIHSSIFAGWDLDGNPDTIGDAGYNNCAGLFGFDTRIASLDKIIDDFFKASIGFFPKAVVEAGKTLSEFVYVSAVSTIRNGSPLLSPRILPTEGSAGVNITPEALALFETIGLLAYYAPNEEHTAIKEIPLSNSVKNLLKIYQSRNEEHKTRHIPSITNFRYTNEALLGILFDDDFSHIDFFQLSLGFLNGGAVGKKYLEDYLNMGLYVAIDAGPDLDHLGEGPLYTWANYDEIGNAFDIKYRDIDSTLTYTTMDDEVSNIRDFARATFKGPSNLTEWYFSTRRILDIMAAACDYGPKYGINYIHSSHVEDLPKIEFIAKDGSIDSAGGQYTSPPITGFNHMDPMFQSANTSGHRQNDVIIPLIEFVEGIID